MICDSYTLISFILVGINIFFLNLIVMLIYRQKIYQYNL